MNSKTQLMTALREEFERWETRLAGLAEGQITAAPDEGGFSIKDTMAHLHAWQQISMARLEAALDHREPDYPAWLGGLDPDAEEHLETINMGVYQTFRDGSWVDVHQVWRDGFRRLLALAEAVPEEDLMEAGRYAWLADDPLSAVLVGTLEHHEEHWDTLLVTPPLGGSDQTVTRLTHGPRENWEPQFESMAAQGHDELLDPPTPTEWDHSQWEGL